MSKLLLGVLAGVLAITIHISAFADAGERESVEELMELMEVDSLIDNYYAQLDQFFTDMAEQVGVRASEQEIFDNQFKKMTAFMREEFSWDKMEGPMIDVYLSNFTAQEIEDLLNLYRSDTGRLLVEKTPIVMGEMLNTGQQMVEELLPKLEELRAELKEELRAHRESQ